MWRFDNTYSRLPASLFEHRQPAVFPAPELVILNSRLARELGLDFEGWNTTELARLFAGQALPEGAVPIAQAYAGHQFGHFTQLGDGRALLWGELRTPSGALVDLAFKGSGQTGYSRRGDGRAALGPMLREYIISEAMHALGIPTTRSLAVVKTGERVVREGPLPGAVLTRVAASHLRVGTFQYAAAWQPESVPVLVQYALQRHDPQLVGCAQPALELLNAVARRQAHLIARWQLVGFLHGVMNTDNMSISGETIDYGPCAFMDAYDPDTVFSSIDEQGRYRYAHQPAIAQWNLARLAEALLSQLDPNQEQAVAKAHAVLNQFRTLYEAEWRSGLGLKLGISQAQAVDEQLGEQLLERMQAHRSDFTNTFRALSGEGELETALAQDPEFQSWQARWRARLAQLGCSLELAQARMRSVNPAVIPRNHRVEEALYAAERRGDLGLLQQLMAALAQPFTLSSANQRYTEPPPASFRDYQTFCGT